MIQSGRDELVHDMVVVSRSGAEFNGLALTIITKELAFATL
jgi:hypothetical protein